MAKKPKANRPSIRVAQKTYQKTLLKRLLTQILAAIFVLLLIYLCFAATIIRVVPTTGAGFPVIKNNTFPGGIIEPGAQVLAKLDGVEINDSIKDNIKHSFVPQKNTAVVEVMAGPTGRIQWEKEGILVVDGQTLDVPFMENPEKEFLVDEYVGVCVTGDCLSGTPVFISADSVYGVTLSEQDFNSDPDFGRLGLNSSDETDATGRLTAESIASLISPVAEAQGGPEVFAPCAGNAIYGSKLTNESVDGLVSAIVDTGELIEPEVQIASSDSDELTSVTSKLGECMNSNKGDTK